MSTRIISLAAIITLIYLSACEKQVHRMDIEPVKKRLVLNGSLGPDRKFKIHVSGSTEPVGPDLVNFIEDAEVSVTDEAGITIHPYSDSMGFYMSDWYPGENKTYRIKVKASGYDDAYADLKIPEKTANVSLSKDPSNTTYPYTIRFQDLPGEENTYMVRAWYQFKQIRNLYNDNGHFIDTLIERRQPTLTSEDEMIKYSADGIYFSDSEFGEGVKSAGGFLISDELFDGKEHDVLFKPKQIFNIDPDRPYLFVEVLCLERQFYNFVKSYCLYYDARQAPFAEPVAILTNVVNGLGFVYGYSVATDSILYK